MKSVYSYLAYYLLWWHLLVAVVMTIWWHLLVAVVMTIRKLRCRP